MLASALRQRVQLQEKITSQVVLGQTVTWKFVRDLYGRKMPLDVKTIARYQQLSTQASSRFIFRGTIEINLGKHRLLHCGVAYEPQSSAKHYDGMTEVIV